ncbi:HET-domain-containing protein [Trematosphaeria pertusa]|uniref:HET-domain-containing protein n=1 Tax=Trematosphaeria pertusa TaxID=390896 RepID=A0A6A6IBU3_9PLEO|nr:HET-domain-containing protein [Trematosphaeria pertusa]KAF2247538.1 HET-domain-containing protein [Trematosphaeria pertusa]
MADPERFRIPARPTNTQPLTPERSGRSRSPLPRHVVLQSTQNDTSPWDQPSTRSLEADGLAASQHPRRSSSASAGSDPSETVKSLSVDGSQINLSGLKSTGNVFKQLFKNVPSKLIGVGEDISEMAIEVKGDTMDLSKTALREIGQGSKKLCSECAKMRFDECIPGGARPSVSTYEYLRPLERIILQRDMCLFCNVLYQAMCREENDPLKSKHIQDHIQNRLKGKSFKEWTEDAHLWKRIFKSGSVWPFGHSRDDTDDGEDIQQAIEPSSGKDRTRIASNMPKNLRTPDIAPEAVLVGGMAGLKGVKMVGNFSKRDRNIIEVADATIVAALLSTAKRTKPLPCWVLVKLHTESSNKSGLLVVHVAARNREPRSSLKEISRFHLRVASTPKYPTKGQPLRYGKILSHHIDVRMSSLWLDVCKDHHPRCQTRVNAPVNHFRVINLEHYCLEDITGGSSVEYAALSYVWGRFEYPVTTQRTAKKYYSTGGLRPENVTLPRSIQDAMVVARQAGLRYLWVDALCILQDSPADLDIQLGHMDKIYKNATLTVVAADGENANSEFKGVLTPRKADQFVAEEVRPNVQILMPLRGSTNLEPWQTRAWTLQEKMLSNRLLVFSGGYMMWHCRESVHYEDMTASDAKTVPGSDRTVPLLSAGLREDDLPASAPLSYSTLNGNVSVTRSPAFEKYASLVADYTHRRMSYSSDVLRALSGILPTLSKTFARRSKEDHEVFRYGLPETLIDVALLWQPVGPLKRRRHCTKPTCTEPYMPSWSWAGWEGDVEYDPTYKVRTDVSGALVQLIEPNGLERIRPLVRFYTKGTQKLSEWAESGCPGSIPKSPGMPPPSPKRPAPPPKKPSLSISGPLTPPIMSNAASRPRTPPAPKSPLLQPDVVPIGILNTFDSHNSHNLWANTDPPAWLPHGTLPWTWEAASPTAFSRKLTGKDVTAGKQYLIFQTQIAQFRLGSTFSLAVTEKVLEADDVDNFTAASASPPTLRRLRPVQSNPSNSDLGWTLKSHSSYRQIIDQQNQEIGRVRVHDSAASSGKGAFDFIVLSEAQFFGDEQSLDEAMGFSLYNVMLVSKPQGSRGVRYRMGVGKLWKHAWRLVGAREEVVVLG